MLLAVTCLYNTGHTVETIHPLFSARRSCLKTMIHHVFAKLAKSAIAFSTPVNEGNGDVTPAILSK